MLCFSAKEVLNRRAFGLTAALVTWAASVTFAGAKTPAVPSMLGNDVKTDGKADVNLEKTKLTLGINGKAGFYYLPLTIAEQLGYFAQVGLDLEIVEFSSTLKVQQALTTGAVDVACGAFDHVLTLHSKSQPVLSFVALGRAPQMAMGVSVKNMPQFRETIDLKGKKIGIVAPGTSSSMMANLVMQRAGLLASEVSFIGVGATTGAVAAMRSGQIDAICHSEPVMTQLEQKGDVKIIADARTLSGTKQLFGGLMPAACVYALPDVLQKNRMAVQNFTTAMLQALRWLQRAGASDVMKTVPESYLLGDRLLYLASYNNMRESIASTGLILDNEAKTALRLLSNFEPNTKLDKIELAKTFTNTFVKRVKLSS